MNDKVKEITEKLEQGVKELFESEKYKTYLRTMSKFHNYSFNNTLLIAMQKPDATLVAGFNSWKQNFSRIVNKGEKGIKILAPMPYKIKQEKEVLDPNTNRPILDEYGQVITEEKEITIPCFKPVTVFDISQTSGEPIPSLAVEELLERVDGYKEFMKALERVAPVPIEYREIESGAKGYFSLDEKKIVIKKGMGETQTVKTAVHEIAHSLLHDSENIKVEGVDFVKKDRNTKEVEAESIAYTVCQHFGIESEDYSFGYLASWSSGKDMKELRSSMDTIRLTASKLITDIEECLTLSKEREKPSLKQNLELKKHQVKDKAKEVLTEVVSL